MIEIVLASIISFALGISIVSIVFNKSLASSDSKLSEVLKEAQKSREDMIFNTPAPDWLDKEKQYYMKDDTLKTPMSIVSLGGGSIRLESESMEYYYTGVLYGIEEEIALVEDSH